MSFADIFKSTKQRYSTRELIKRPFNLIGGPAQIDETKHEHSEESAPQRDKNTTTIIETPRRPLPDPSVQTPPPLETPPPGDVSVTFIASTPKVGPQLAKKRKVSDVRKPVSVLGYVLESVSHHSNGSSTDNSRSVTESLPPTVSVQYKATTDKTNENSKYGPRKPDATNKKSGHGVSNKKTPHKDSPSSNKHKVISNSSLSDDRSTRKSTTNKTSQKGHSSIQSSSRQREILKHPTEISSRQSHNETTRNKSRRDDILTPVKGSVPAKVIRSKRSLQPDKTQPTDSYSTGHDNNFVDHSTPGQSVQKKTKQHTKSNRSSAVTEKMRKEKNQSESVTKTTARNSSISSLHADNNKSLTGKSVQSKKHKIQKPLEEHSQTVSVLRNTPGKVANTTALRNNSDHGAIRSTPGKEPKATALRNTSSMIGRTAALQKPSGKATKATALRNKAAISRPPMVEPEDSISADHSTSQAVPSRLKSRKQSNKTGRKSQASRNGAEQMEEEGSQLDVTVLMLDPGVRRHRTDITYIDVALSCIADSIKEQSDRCDCMKDRKVLHLLEKYIVQDLSSAVLHCQTLRQLRSRVKKHTASIKEKQKTLFSLQKRRMELEWKCRPLDFQLECSERMTKVNDFITDMRTLIANC